MNRAPLYFLVVVLIISIGFPLLVVAQGVFFPMSGLDFIYLAGKFFALIGFFVLTFQYLWTIKMRFIEKLRSYDSRVAVHRTLGFLGILLISLHPVFILVNYAVAQIPLTITVPMGAGFFGLVLLLLISGSTFLGRIWQVPYESWKRLHRFTFPILTLVFFHSLLLGSDMYGFTRVVWFVLYGFHVTILLWKIIHKVRFWSKKYKVISVEQVRPNITSLVLEKPRRKYIPGQYAFISLKIGGKWEPWHPFSLTSNQSEAVLSMSIKALGDFTTKIPQVEPGDYAKIDAGYGAFSPHVLRDSRYVMIAGGVGIAPIYGILKDLKEYGEPPDVILLYSVHHESDLLFREDLDEWFSRFPNWSVHYICSSQPDWPGLKGRITEERVLSLCENDLRGSFFLCGPFPMVQSISKFLRSSGVPRRKIKREHFVFLP